MKSLNGRPFHFSCLGTHKKNILGVMLVAEKNGQTISIPMLKKVTGHFRNRFSCLLSSQPMDVDGLWFLKRWKAVDQNIA